MVKGRWVGFQCDVGLAEVECLIEPREKVFQVSWRQHRWRAATEIECRDRLGRDRFGITRAVFCFCDDSVDERADIRIARCVFVKGTIGADPMTKRDVEVKNQDSRDQSEEDRGQGFIVRSSWLRSHRR